MAGEDEDVDAALLLEILSEDPFQGEIFLGTGGGGTDPANAADGGLVDPRPSPRLIEPSRCAGVYLISTASEPTRFLEEVVVGSSGMRSEPPWCFI